MRRRSVLLAVAVLAAGLLVVSLAGAAGGKKVFRADLDGYNEVPAVSSNGFGSARIVIDDDAQTIAYRLSYGGLNADAIAAHIHFGQKDVNGGVSAFLCGGGDKPVCPLGTGAEETVSDVIDAADVIGPAGQGIAAGEFDELVDAIRAGVTYVNVHSTAHPGGEIRDQLR